MKNKNNPGYFIMALIVAAFAAVTWSCNKDDDPSLRDLREDKLAYLEDSLRISDSLRRINAAGVVNYAITVVSGSTSTLFKQAYDDGSRTSATKSAVEDAIVTISQFGKVQKDTTDESGMVVFNGFFRTAVNITIEKAGFTKVSYISVLNTSDSTINSGIYFVGNLIPVFELTGPNTATISGRVNIQTNLTNKTREAVPDGTTITASIDAEDSDFADVFLTTDIAYSGISGSSGNDLIYVGNILDASYSTNVVGTITGGNYTITVPAAVNGLPIDLDYSDVAADQTLFEFGGPGVVLPGNRIATYRTIYEAGIGALSDIPDGADIDISFTGAGSGAAAYALVSNGEISEIIVTAGGSGYAAGTTTVNIASTAGGTGAAATATVNASGVITGVTLTNRGAGYLSANYPSDPEVFTATKGFGLDTRPGIKYINDVYYGTGVRQPN